MPRRLLLFAVLALGCATISPQGATRFQVQCNVPDAMVLVDDVLIGRCAEWSQPGRYIRAGFHRVEIRHPDHYSHFSEVEAPDGGAVLVRAQLYPLLD